MKTICRIAAVEWWELIKRRRFAKFAYATLDSFTTSAPCNLLTSASVKLQRYISEIIRASGADAGIVSDAHCWAIAALDRAELRAGDQPLAKIISYIGVQKSEACSHRLG
jgi:hypothetical protein